MNSYHPENYLESLTDKYGDLQETIGQFVVGNADLIEMIMLGILSGGSVLIEGLPGTAKTTIVKTMAILMGCETRRLQCGIDTQPSDILGVRTWNPEARDFEIRKGPAFTNILMIDEINRLPPKSQSAFIETMSEQQATIDGITLEMPEPFFAIATQNPYEMEGVFPLIEVQKDRFMFSMMSTYLGREGEYEVLMREQNGSLDWDRYASGIRPIFNRESLIKGISEVQKVHVDPVIMGYIRDIVIATRSHGDLRMGVSTRASIALLRGSRAYAALHQRDYVIPDDIKVLVPLTFRHRLFFRHEAEISGVLSGSVINQILNSVEVP